MESIENLQEEEEFENHRTSFPTGENELNCGSYECKRNGVKLNGKRIICHPLTVVSEIDNIDDDVAKVELAYYKNGHWKRCIVERQTLFNKSKIPLLANYTIDASSNNAGQLLEYIRCLLNMNDLPIKRTVSSLGWRDDEFVPFDSEVFFDGEANFRKLYDCIVNPKGNETEWNQACKKMVANSVPARVLVWGAFASPLLAKLDVESFCVHLWGGTGTGKSVALILAASVWGDPSHGKYFKTMNMTHNAMMSTASMLGNLPLCGDELQTIKKRYKNGYDDLIMQITEGIDRERMQYNKIITSDGWQSTFLFTGEEQCTSRSSGAGVLNRVIELQTDTKLIPSVGANDYVNVLKNNYGIAGKKFLETVKYYDIRQMFREFFAMFDLDVVTSKVATNWSVIFIVDAIMSKYLGIKPLTMDDVKPFLISQDDVNNASRAMEYMASLIGENKAHFSPRLATSSWGGWFSDNPDEASKGQIDPYGERVQYVDYVLIDSKVLERELNALGFKFDKKMRADWEELGFLQRIGQNNRYAYPTSVNNAKSVYYRLNWKPGI